MASAQLTKIPTLYVFGGLPATGKSSLSKALARARGAMHLRIDTIEQMLREIGITDVAGSGYEIAHKIAADNLRLGQSVVADCVNPWELTRSGWREVGVTQSAKVVEIEVLCSDVVEHQRRVDSRSADISGLVLPTWSAIQKITYQPWNAPHLVIDTARHTLEQSVTELLEMVALAD